MGKKASNSNPYYRKDGLTILEKQWGGVSGKAGKKLVVLSIMVIFVALYAFLRINVLLGGASGVDMMSLSEYVNAEQGVCEPVFSNNLVNDITCVNSPYLLGIHGDIKKSDDRYFMVETGKDIFFATYEAGEQEMFGSAVDYIFKKSLIRQLEPSTTYMPCETTSGYLNGLFVQVNSGIVILSDRYGEEKWYVYSYGYSRGESRGTLYLCTVCKNTEQFADAIGQLNEVAMSVEYDSAYDDYLAYVEAGGDVENYSGSKSDYEGSMVNESSTDMSTDDLQNNELEMSEGEGVSFEKEEQEVGDESAGIKRYKANFVITEDYEHPVIVLNYSNTGVIPKSIVVSSPYGRRYQVCEELTAYMDGVVVFNTLNGFVQGSWELIVYYTDAIGDYTIYADDITNYATGELYNKYVGYGEDETELSTELSTEVLTEISTEVSTEALTEISTEVSTEIPVGLPAEMPAVG